MLRPLTNICGNNQKAIGDFNSFEVPMVFASSLRAAFFPHSLPCACGTPATSLTQAPSACPHPSIACSGPNVSGFPSFTRLRHGLAARHFLDAGAQGLLLAMRDVNLDVLDARLPKPPLCSFAVGACGRSDDCHTGLIHRPKAGCHYPWLEEEGNTSRADRNVAYRCIRASHHIYDNLLAPGEGHPLGQESGPDSRSGMYERDLPVPASSR